MWRPKYYQMAMNFYKEAVDKKREEPYEDRLSHIESVERAEQPYSLSREGL